MVTGRCSLQRCSCWSQGTVATQLLLPGGPGRCQRRGGPPSIAWLLEGEDDAQLPTPERQWTHFPTSPPSCQALAHPFQHQGWSQGCEQCSGATVRTSLLPPTPRRPQNSPLQAIKNHWGNPALPLLQLLRLAPAKVATTQEVKGKEEEERRLQSQPKLVSSESSLFLGALSLFSALRRSCWPKRRQAPRARDLRNIDF